MNRIVDAHHHIWDLAAADYPWLGPEAGPLFRSFHLDETAPARQSRGIDAVILVQAADNDEDTAHLLSVARAQPDVAGVVAWTPLDDPEGTRRRLSTWADQDARVVGIRSLLHERQDTRWILSPVVEEGLRGIADAGLPLDYVTSDHDALAHLPELTARHPDLVVVVDHLGKPPIGGSQDSFDDWRRLLLAAAHSPRVHAKLSGLYPADGPLDRWRTDDIRPFVDTAIEIFGPSRLLMGSDWPIAELAGGYERTWDALTSTVASLSEAERRDVMGGTADRVYALQGVSPA
ncbi:amidohydrolase family protein [Herbiconiux sp. CPCC 205763]|uniref:Amidohydrolase family protein n=1 Tax=Herbiconiux aconitum TaxID=2970913 RepID=A0ABT2GN35_9MICO|nr:amidohydrolase family protein [Herbiconiux aconitum]MCS5717629.1 amidohydrolase family protein [Herbiconiux aconitum]